MPSPSKKPDYSIRRTEPDDPLSFSILLDGDETARMAINPDAKLEGLHRFNLIRAALVGFKKPAGLNDLKPTPPQNLYINETEDGAIDFFHINNKTGQTEKIFTLAITSPREAAKTQQIALKILDLLQRDIENPKKQMVINIKSAPPAYRRPKGPQI